MENLDSEFNILEIDINSGRERHIYVFLVSFKNFCKIQRQPSIVYWYFINVKFRK